MPTKHSIPNKLKTSVAILCITVLGQASGADTPENGAAQNSTLVTQVIPRQAAPLLEFRGVLIDDEGEWFKIFDKEAQQSVWVGLNEMGHDMIVRRYDNRREVVTVEYRQRMITLPLRKGLKRKSPPQTLRQMTQGEINGNGATPTEVGSSKPSISLVTGSAAQVGEGSSHRETVRQEMSASTVKPSGENEKNTADRDTHMEKSKDSAQ